MEKQSWYSKCKILGIRKETPILRITSGIKKDRQEYYDNSPFLHGSNGTYAFHTPDFWAISYRVYKIAPDIEGADLFTTDIHDYIAGSLMPRMKWSRISANRLDWLNGKIAGMKIKVITFDMDKAPIYREYIPFGYKNWDEFLDAYLI